MEIRLLRMFCTVAETGSLVAAAGRLHLTPSALSHGLKSLETQLGCRLFERAGKRMLLNQAGEQLLAQIQPPMAALDAAAESLKQLGKWGHTRLRIGATASACQHILPSVIRELKKSEAQLQLQVESGDMPAMLDLVRANKVDLALGVAPESQNGLELQQIFRDELMFVFAPSHPWAVGRPITRDELRQQPFILYKQSSYTVRAVEDYFRKLDLVPSTIMEIASIEAIKELVKLNLGVSVLAPWAVGKDLARGSLRMRPVGPHQLRRLWVIAMLAGRRLSLIEENFCRLCRNHTAGMPLDRRDVPALKR